MNGITPLIRLLPMFAAGVLLVGATPLFGDEALPGERLREAWIEHRLRGHLELARAGYREVAASTEATADIRARAHLGLALLARDVGDVAAVRSELKSVLGETSAAPRWRRTARLLRAELEGTAPDGGDGEADLLVQLQGRVASLQDDLNRVLSTVADREEELERKDRMLRRLEEREREALASGVAGHRQEEVQRTKASRWLEELVLDDRQQQRLQRSLIRSHLLSGREAFRERKFNETHNEMKKILSLDPLHREALELSSRCRTLLAASAGVEPFEDPEPGRMGVTPPDLVEELTISAMRAWLGEARRHQSEGRLLEAIQSASKVLEEYSWSPAPLPEDVVEELVGGAERVLEECAGFPAGTEESTAARELRGRQLDLIARLRERFSQLMATELALAEADESAQRLAERDSTELPLELVREFQTTMEAAELALSAKRLPEAARHHRELLILLEWAPELDPDGTIRPELERQLATLEGRKPAKARGEGEVEGEVESRPGPEGARKSSGKSETPGPSPGRP